MGFDRHRISTECKRRQPTDTSLSFRLTMDGHVMLTAGLLGMAIGVVGGALPAFSSTRLPLAIALRDRR